MTETILRIISEHTTDEPIKSRQIELRTQLSGAEIREIVHELRLSKHPIASDDRGYYMARSEQELEHTKAQLRSRGSKILEVARALDDCFASKEQLSLL